MQLKPKGQNTYLECISIKGLVEPREWLNCIENMLKAKGKKRLTEEH